MLSAEWYRENMPRYKAAFEDGMIELPRDADILADHRALVIEHGYAHVPDGAREASAGRRHGDAAIAGALAYYASSSYREEAAYIPAPRRHARPRPGGGARWRLVARRMPGTQRGWLVRTRAPGELACGRASV